VGANLGPCLNEIGDYARLAEALPGVLAEQPWLAEG
jgi:hypothetical protein